MTASFTFTEINSGYNITKTDKRNTRTCRCLGEKNNCQCWTKVRAMGCCPGDQTQPQIPFPTFLLGRWLAGLSVDSSKPPSWSLSYFERRIKAIIKQKVSIKISCRLERSQWEVTHLKPLELSASLPAYLLSFTELPGRPCHPLVCYWEKNMSSGYRGTGTVASAFFFIANFIKRKRLVCKLFSPPACRLWLSKAFGLLHYFLETSQKHHVFF